MTERERRPVLIVDDDPLIISQVGEVLQSAGFSFIHASNGVEGLRQLTQGDPGLVILDINMPELDGMQTCRMIRANEKFRDLPILMLTSRGDITHMMEARRVGADDYLVKPVDRTKLLGKVERLFAR
jgi:Response regulators consisting of a CheY-like receiver domain and a winged-helix DNA-binding domain